MTVVRSMRTENDNSKTITISDLTLQEKISLLSGSSIWDLAAISRLGIPSITLSDGPHGVRKQLNDLSLHESHPATCFPAGCALSCSWNVETLYQMGQALSVECQLHNISVLLGPAMNLKRHPAGGRNLEYFSEDPYLTGILASAYVQGVQASGNVGACVKHFAMNNQESHRFVVNAVVDERTARELYLKAFQMVIQSSHPAMVMGAYNKWNGVYCCEHPHLLQEILRDEWDFQGVCVTDWGATNDRVAGIQAGLDLEMPGNRGVHEHSIYQALRDGRLSEVSSIDPCASRILDLLQRFPAQNPHSTTKAYLDTPKRQEIFDLHNRLAHEIALDCVVLLKNEDHTLPLQRNIHLAVIGAFAKESRYQGMGSSHCTPTKVSHAIDSLWQYSKNIKYAAGYDPHTDRGIHDNLIQQAKATALDSDVVLLFLGLPEIMESEGFDRETLKLPDQHLALLETISAVHNKVIVLLSNGGVVELPDSIRKASAIMEGFLLGQAGGSAIADLLFGVVSPSGRLAETMPMAAEHIPANDFFPGTRDTVEYREGLSVGYRYFDVPPSGDNGAPAVRFPFGHGLTYTEFEYSNLCVQCNMDDDENKEVHVTFCVRNIGNVAAKEVPQCYVAPLDPSVYRPYHELKAFKKINLEPGASSEISFVLTEAAFAFFDIGHTRWIVERGRYEIQIGKSSQDIQLQHTIEFQKGIAASELAKESYPSQGLTGSKGWKSDDIDSFSLRFGRNSPKVMPRGASNTAEEFGGPIHRNSLIKEVAASGKIGSALFTLLFFVACKEVKNGPTREREIRMVRANLENIPLRSIVLFSKGALSLGFLDAFIALLNGNHIDAWQKFGRMSWSWVRRMLGYDD